MEAKDAYMLLAMKRKPEAKAKGDDDEGVCPQCGHAYEEHEEEDSGDNELRLSAKLDEDTRKALFARALKGSV